MSGAASPKRPRTLSRGGSGRLAPFSRPSARLSVDAPSPCGQPRNGLPDPRTSRRGRRGSGRCARNVRHPPGVRPGRFRSGRRSRRAGPRLRSRSFGRIGRRPRHARCSGRRRRRVSANGGLRPIRGAPPGSGLQGRRTSRSRGAPIFPTRDERPPNDPRHRRTSRLRLAPGPRRIIDRGFPRPARGSWIGDRRMRRRSGLRPRPWAGWGTDALRS